METKYCPTCGHIMVETTAGAYCPNTSCTSREFRFDPMPEPLFTNEPIIISRACPINCPGNIPEAKTRALIEAARAVLDIDDTGALGEDDKDKLFALKAELEGEG